MSTRKFLLEDGVNHLLLEDGTDFLLLEGTPQSSDDVIIRLGPGVTITDGSGLIAPAFTPITPPGGSTVNGAYYYMMMQEWFDA